jgi:hypothetical protein
MLNRYIVYFILIKLKAWPIIEPITSTFVYYQPSSSRIVILDLGNVLQVTKAPSDPRNIRRNERSLRSSGVSSGNLQSSEFGSELENQDRQLTVEPGKHSSDESLQSNRLEGP